MNNESKAKISNKNQPTPTSCHFRGVYLSHPNTRKLDFTPEDGPFKDQQISLDITVNSVNEKVLPDADDDFAKMASEFDTLEELKKDLEGRREHGLKEA